MTEHVTREGVFPRRDFKDTLFRLIFREKKNLLSLYNAVNNTNYTNPDDLEIVTLENAIYMDMKNDEAFRPLSQEECTCRTGAGGTYAILLPIKDAVERAVLECIGEGILADILTGYRREVVQMSIFEFDAEREWAIIRRDERLTAKEELRDEVEAEVRAKFKAELQEQIKTEIRAEVTEEVALSQMFRLVRKNLLSAEVAAAELNMTVQEFLDKMQTSES